MEEDEVMTVGGGLQVETFPDKHDSMEDYLETLKYAFLYAKTVTLGKWVSSKWSSGRCHHERKVPWWPGHSRGVSS
jgi:hypothetical protein